MVDLLPMERAIYIHHCVGGSEDGRNCPSIHRYDTLRVNGVLYKWDGEEPKPGKSENWEVINCTDDYMEPVFFSVTMNLVLEPKCQISMP